MCGIAGIIDAQRATIEDSVITRMAESIQHRGPDHAGTLNEHGVALAFTRLAILDLSEAGNQPMHSHDDSAVIVFNGELYNYEELRKELQQRGRKFTSQSDTEVVLQSYLEFGPSCLERFNGMFAFVIWDKRRDEIFCARDRFGIKPFYYWHSERFFVFGSEIKALLQSGQITPSVDVHAVQEYFTFQNILSDRTMFEGIRILPAGHTIRLDRSGIIERKQYWDPEFKPENNMNEEDAIEQVRALFSQAVQRHLVSDVPVGSQLSGGIDSAGIVAMASKHIPNLMTFTAGFDTELANSFEANFDERNDAELIAKHFKTQHYQMLIQSGDMERIFPKLIWHFEDLRLGNSYPNYYISQLSQKFVKVCLSGAGGDELFGGYPWRYENILHEKTTSGFDEKYFSSWQRLMPIDHHNDFFTPSVVKKIDPQRPFTIYRSVIEKMDGHAPLDKALYFELKTFLHGLLIVEDKTSSAHGLEVRVPFLDKDLVAFALRIPSSLKLRGDQGKFILREAIRPVVPPHIVNKKKQGFSAPEQHWFRQSLRTYTHTLLNSPTSNLHTYIEPKYIQKILREHDSGAVNHRLLIWSLLSFEWWLRTFIQQEQPR